MGRSPNKYSKGFFLLFSMAKFLKKFRNSNFIGTQLSRFKMGMGYYSMIMSTVSALMLIKTAYPSFQFEHIALLLPLPVFATLYIGYFMDKKNINTMDTMKSNEMAHRFLLKSDVKSQEFQLMQTKLLMTALKSLKDENTVDLDSIEKKYDEYRSKWKSPY